MQELRVRLLGAWQITVGDTEIAGLGSRKAQELLALVLLAPQRSVLREVAADSLWPSTPPEASKKAVRQVLWQIHQATDVAFPDEPRLMLSDGELIRVNPSRAVWLDVAAFEQAARRRPASTTESLGRQDLQSLADAASLYRGSLLAGCYDDWCLVERSHLEDLQLTLLDRLSVGYERLGDFPLAIQWAQALLEIEPAHERSHRRLMRLYYLTDDRTRALRQYDRCRWLLEHEFGVRPSARTQALAAAIGEGAGAVGDGAPAAAVDAAALLGSFRAELASLRASVEAIGDRVRESTT